LLARNPSPHIGTWVEPSWSSLASGLFLVFFPDRQNLPLDVGECLERNVRDVVFLAIFLEPKALAREENIGFTGSRKIRYTVANENNQGNLAINAILGGLGATFLNRKGLVMAKLRIVSPDRFPFRAVRLDIGVICNDLN
jgi:hypothetical protein